MRRTVIGVVVLVVVLAVVGVVLLSSQSQQAAALTKTGVIVVWRHDGSFVLTDADGTHPRDATAAGMTAQPPITSTDGRVAVDIGGTLLSLTASGVRTLDRHLWDPRETPIVAVNPFVDHGRLIALGGRGGFDRAVRAEFRNRHGRVLQHLGPDDPDEVAGDPQHAGVFVTLPIGVPIDVGSQFEQADSALALVPRNGASRTLLTARQARRLLHETGPVSMFALPSNDGSRVAVEVDEVRGEQSGIVIADRSGRVLDSFAAASRSSWLVWSTAGDLAVVSDLPPAALVWTDGNVRHLPLRFPAGELLGGGCDWSPDATVLLCSTADETDIAHWLLVRISDGRQQVVPAVGYPVAWLDTEAE